MVGFFLQVTSNPPSAIACVQSMTGSQDWSWNRKPGQLSVLTDTDVLWQYKEMLPFEMRARAFFGRLHSSFLLSRSLLIVQFQWSWLVFFSSQAKLRKHRLLTIQYSLCTLHRLITYAILIIIYQTWIFAVQLLTIRVTAGVSIHNVAPAFVNINPPVL